MLQEWGVQLVVWGGLVFDLLIVPMLLHRRTRSIGFSLVLCFHLMNALVWEIGVFPWLMILLTTVHFEPDWPQRIRRGILGRRVRPSGPLDAIPQPGTIRRRIGVTFLAVFVIWQCLFPLRWLLSPGHPHWDEYQHVFSWHMMLRAKQGGLRVYATQPDTRRSGTIDLRRYLSGRQLNVVARDPVMIHQLCREIAADFQQRGYGRIELRALSLVSLNGRRPQLMVDPTVDLAARPVPRGYPDYVLPLTEELRHDGWTVPLQQWESQIELKLPVEMSPDPTTPASPGIDQS